ncbi:hypothetical protein [Kitasatospora sp. NPDC059673]|uniref:hypothetical protein n=1 Tax=Kitasatospora sp. NPDC059673 TaxID=3346901 RepID=UPI0036853F3D
MPAETSVTGRASYTVQVHVADDTTRDQARALCRRITELGYGPGGSHNIDLLTVSGSGSYTSTPGGPACLEGN